MDKPRVVVSYTTMPSRYDVLKKSIASIHAQTYKVDAIYVTIPYRSARLNKEYPPIPDDLSSLCTIIRTETDYGPITKIYGGLISEKDQNTVIITCDDDVGFPSNLIEILMKHHLTHPKDVICGTGALIGRGLPFISIVSTVSPFKKWSGLFGFDVSSNGRCIDLVFGVGGVLYTRGMFPTNEDLEDKLLKYTLQDPAIFHNDDVLISGYLSKQGISRRLFLNIPEIIHYNGSDALSSDIIRMITRLNESIDKVKSYGFYPVMEPLSMTETPAARIFFGIIIIIVIILLCIWLYFILNRPDWYSYYSSLFYPS
jgi:GT2 family glycosyltransferase